MAGADITFQALLVHALHKGSVQATVSAGRFFHSHAVFLRLSCFLNAVILSANSIIVCGQIRVLEHQVVEAECLLWSHVDFCAS